MKAAMTLDAERFRLVHRLPTSDVYLRLRAAVGFSPRSQAAAEPALANTIHSVLAETQDGTDILGMARLIGDRGVYFEISDVIVLPEVQRQGIGRALVEDLLTWMRDNAPATAALRVLTTADNVGFYRSRGLQEAPATVRVLTFRKS